MELMGPIPNGADRVNMATIKPGQFPSEQPSTVKDNAEEFYSAWEEARLAHYGDEPRRAAPLKSA